MAACFRERNRIVDTHRCTTTQQLGNQPPARSLPHIVGIRLECKAPDRQMPALEHAVEITADYFQQHGLLPRVDALDRCQHIELHAMLFGGIHEACHAFREERPTVAAARIEEAIADTRIRADSAPYVLDICSNAVS